MNWPGSPSGMAVAIDPGMLIQSAALFKAKVLSLKSLTVLLPGRYAILALLRPSHANSSRAAA